MELTDNERQAIRQAFADCDGLLITAGAGMGVDSGLPDFRGREGFWQAYPALAQAGLDFHIIASPNAFKPEPPPGLGVLWASAQALPGDRAACRICHPAGTGSPV